jgi:hypothetical protein
MTTQVINLDISKQAKGKSPGEPDKQACQMSLNGHPLNEQ